MEISTLPINSRAVSSSPLAALATIPMSLRIARGTSAWESSTSAQTGFSVDGISTANVRANGALRDAYPSMEGIQEMSVTAFNNNAAVCTDKRCNLHNQKRRQPVSWKRV